MVSFVVTGANRGIGFEFVRQLSTSASNAVFALVRDPKTADGLKNLNRSNVHILEADVTDVKALKAAAEYVSKATGGTLDVLINNAAFIDTKNSHYRLHGYADGDELALENDLEYTFKVNVVGVIHTTNIFLPLVIAGKTKKAILISSGVADPDLTVDTDFYMSGPYAMSKAAANMAYAKYAAQYRKEGLVFLSISPGLVNTAVKAPTPEELKIYEEMIVSFKKYAPNFTGPITPEESVTAVLGVINRATVKDSGAFVSHKGNKEWL